MAPKFTSFLLLILFITLLFIQIHGRESHFFSKIPNNNYNNNNPDNFDNNDTKQTQIPNKVEYDYPLTNPEKTTNIPPQDQQQPNFIPQTQENSYGLYGHESGQLPPNSDSKFSDPTGDRSFTTTTYNNNNNFRTNDVVPNYKSESEDQYYNYDDNNFQSSSSSSNSKPYENSFYYNKDLYNDNNEPQSFQNTRLSRDDFTTTPLYDQQKYDGDDNNNNNGNNVARQGMSDTKFMENGRYYYDLNREPRHYRSSRDYFRRNNNNNNNANTYEYGNSMGRYKNVDEATDFQEEADEFVP